MSFCGTYPWQTSALFVPFVFCIMCLESMPLDTTTKARFMLGQALFRAARLQRSLLGSHSAWQTTQLCGWRPHSRLCTQSFATMTNEEKSSHNSFLDINDLWHLRSKSLQLHSAADLQGGISAGWIMPDMKGSPLQFKVLRRLLVYNINLLSRKHGQKNSLSLCTSILK